MEWLTGIVQGLLLQMAAWERVHDNGAGSKMCNLGSEQPPGQLLLLLLVPGLLFLQSLGGPAKAVKYHRAGRRRNDYGKAKKIPQILHHGKAASCSFYLVRLPRSHLYLLAYSEAAVSQVQTSRCTVERISYFIQADEDL